MTPEEHAQRRNRLLDRFVTCCLWAAIVLGALALLLLAV